MDAERDGGYLIRINKTRTESLYNRKIEEKYEFRFDDIGRLSEITLKVYVDESGSGRTTTNMIEEHPIDLEYVPKSIQSTVMNMLTNGMEDLQ